jgi:hypothetical protein
MHTATEIQTDMMAVLQQGKLINPNQLLALSTLDRFGIVVHEPYGALGAGLLLSLAITSFYEAAGRDRNLYPEIYLFHVGGPWGSHSSFDFWPEGKEVFVENGPVAVLRAINQYGITHLAVPDVVRRQVMHRYRETEIAAYRLKQCYAYSATGTVAQGDVQISTSSSKIIWNYEAALAPELYVLDMEEAVRTDVQLQSDEAMAADYRRVISYLRERWGEVSRDSEAYMHMSKRVAGATAAASLVETYRTIDTVAALEMLAS